jgi:uncharacterized protein YegJ (DUF2314 family)
MFHPTNPSGRPCHSEKWRRADGRRVYLVLLLVVPVMGCWGKSPVDKVIPVADDDPKMNAAIEKARSTVNTFIAALNSPKAGQTSFTVKKAFSDGKHTEHMWLSPVTYDGTTFQGVVNNDADMVSNVKIGQKASVGPKEISDWMYVENGKLVGGYTVRVLREAMPANERAEFDKSMPFTIE